MLLHPPGSKSYGYIQQIVLSYENLVTCVYEEQVIKCVNQIKRVNNLNLKF